MSSRDDETTLSLPAGPIYDSPPANDGPGVPPDQTQLPSQTVEINGDVNEEGSKPSNGVPPPVESSTLATDAKPADGGGRRSDDCSLGLSRGDRLFTGVLAVAILALLAIHWALLSGWGVRPVDVVRQAPQSFEYSLDINTATWVELSQLDEIGEVLARRIVEDREANGPFASVDDLRRVKRIGPATLKKIRPWVRASDQDDL